MTTRPQAGARLQRSAAASSAYALQHAADGLFAALLLLAAAVAPAPSHAASATTNFTVSATVVDSCAVSAANLAFGVYDPTSLVDKTGTTTLTITCSLGTPYTVSLNDGSNAAGGNRRMASGAHRLIYQLYHDAGATQIFGTVAALLGASGMGTGVGVPLLVYGVVPKAQNVNVGAYTDTVTVTVDY